MSKQLWKYTRILKPGEEHIRLEIVEDNDVRVMVRPVNCGYENWALPPIWNLNRDEVEPAEDQETDKEQTT